MSEIGQVTPTDLLETYRFRALGSSTALYGVVGSPVGHSISPAIHNAAFEAGKVDAVYLPFDAADADDFVTFARALKLAGASVTIPFKVSLYGRVDEADAVARRIGAINTIRVVGGRWLGGNTDAGGFLRPLQEGRVPLEGTRASVLGAGGAARAVAIALASSRAQITVHARKADQAAAIATIVSARVGPWPPEPGSWDLLVNCTPIGMHPHGDRTPMPADRLTGRVVYDLVYNPAITALLRDATRAGCQTIGGLDMLVAQAEDQFLWWTGVRPHSGVMRSAALKRLSEFMADENYVV
jgi:shikimate dehydrogenase